MNVSLFEIMSYPFMQRALLGALITGLIAPSLGIYLVQRKMSLIGDGIGHIALTGVGVGLLTGSNPVVTAIIVSALGAVAVELIRERGRTSGDMALAILFYGGIAGGVFLVGLAPGKGSANLTSYLFGSLVTTRPEDLVARAVLGACVLAVTVGLRPWLFAVCQDEEYAKVSGLPVRAINLLLAVMTAVTVTVAMRTVGLLLVSALMVVPVAVAQLVSRGFAGTMALAMLGGVVSAGTGMTLSGGFNLQPGATIVLVAIALFVLVALAGTALRRRRRAQATPSAVCEPPECVLDS